MSAILLAFTFLMLSQSAQSVGFARPISPETTTIIKTALDKLERADAAKFNYTRIDVQHNQNFLPNGKRFVDSRWTYEDTWLFGAPYKNLLAFNGKALDGRALEEEKARFERAVQERKGFDLTERAKVVGGKNVQEEYDLGRILTGDYRLEVLRFEKIRGVRCHVYSAQPVTASSANDETDAPFGYKLWISEEESVLLKLEIARRGGRMKNYRLETGLIEWRFLNGLPVEVHTRFNAMIDIDGRMIEARTDDVYSGYRRFSTSMRIVPGLLTPEPASSSHPD